MNPKKSFQFAIVSAVYISFFTGITLACLGFFLNINWVSKTILGIVIFVISVFGFSFLLLQYRSEKFIFKRVKKIYDELSFLDATPFLNPNYNTDLNEISREVKKFASDKKLEIELLKERETYRREFLGNVSHELKTPLFTVQGYISTLIDGGMKDKSIRKKYLERAEKGVERLIAIVQDLDMISKLETGDLNLSLTTFNIIEMIQNVFDLLELKAQQKNIILTFDNKYSKPILVVADQEKIQQLLTNLVVNAIKYGKYDGFVEIGVEKWNDNKWIVKVLDNGDGIESQHLPRVFERFFRVDKSGARSEGGSGLGLSIVKHIAEAHNERVFVKSEIGKSTEFSFTIQNKIIR